MRAQIKICAHDCQNVLLNLVVNDKRRVVPINNLIARIAFYQTDACHFIFCAVNGEDVARVQCAYICLTVRIYADGDVARVRDNAPAVNCYGIIGTAF